MANDFQPVQKGKIIEDSVQMFLDGKAFHGWQTVSVVESLESIANSFSLGVDDKFAGLNAAWPFRPGKSVKINIGQGWF